MKLILITLLSSTLIFAQENLPKIPSDSLIKLGIIEMDNGNYEKANTLLNQISHLSPDYPVALYEMAYSNYLNDKKETSIEYLKKIEHLGYLKDDFAYFQLYANTYDVMEDYAKANERYSMMIEKFPNKNFSYYDYAVSLYSQGKVQEAIDQLQKSLYLNPTHSKSLSILGAIALENGYLSEALSTLIVSMYLAPESPSTRGSIISLNQLLVQKWDGYKQELDFHKGKQNPFSEIEELLKAQYALSADYDNESEFNDKFLNQMHLYLNSLSDIKNNDSYYNEFFIPFLKELNKNTEFHSLACIFLSSLDSKDLDKTINKEIPNIKKSVEKMKYNNAFDLLYKRNSDLNGNKGSFYYNISRGELSGVGVYKNEALEGEWTYLYPKTGKVFSKLNYENGKANGDYFEYYESGNLKEKGNYKYDQKDGSFLLYDTTGNKVSDIKYKNDKLDGLTKYFYPNNQKLGEVEYKEDVLNGPGTYYYPDGTKKIDLAYKDGQQNGKKVFYNIDGSVEYEMTFKNDLLDGNRKAYYKNNLLSANEFYKNGEYIGTQTYYFTNGNISKKFEYDDNNKLRTQEEYYPNEKLREIHQFNKNGILDGEGISYFNNGLKNTVITYQDGEAKQFISYDRKGNEVQNVKIKRGDSITYLNELGEPQSKGKKVRNSFTGKWTYYMPNGKIQSTANYNKEGELHGETIGYHPNGKIAYQSNYINGKANGLYKNYYSNGNLKYYGVYSNDEEIGEWVHLNPDKTIDYKHYFINGELLKEQHFNFDDTAVITYVFDDEGKIVKFQTHAEQTTDYDFEKMQNGTFKINYATGMNWEINLLNNTLHGQSKVTNKKGEIISTGNYKNGEKTGQWKYYNSLNTNSVIRNYEFGKLWGKQTFYDLNGNLATTRFKTNGLDSGLITAYYFSGEKRYEFEQIDDIPMTPVTYFGTNGEVLLKKYELDNTTIYYSLNDNEEMKKVVKGKANIIAKYKNGNVGLEFDLENGEFHGKYNLYYSDGSPYLKSTREYGAETGLYTIFYPNGNTYISKELSNGNLSGVTKLYYENGTLKAELNYKNDQLHGDVKIYNNSGKLIELKKYNTGYLYESSTY